MKTVRVKFTKGEQIKFISHLDLMNAFQRAVRRARLNAEYSNGFNPHMQMVFGAPLSLGYRSVAEYADLSFYDDYKASYVMDRLNDELPPGIRILDAAERSGKKNIMADISFAEYSFCIPAHSSQDDICNEIMKLGRLEAVKTRKGRSRTIDIRPLVIEFECLEDRSRLLAKAGNEGSLNPRLLSEAVSSHIGETIRFTDILRTEQYVERNGRMVLPLSEQALGDG